MHMLGFEHQTTLDSEYTSWLFSSRGGGLVVSALAYCSEDPSLNPVDYLIFLFIVQKDENKPKRGRGWPIFLKVVFHLQSYLKSLCKLQIRYMT